MTIEKQYVVVALIFFLIYVIFAFTLPHLKIFKPTREHAQQLFILIYIPVAITIGILLGCIILDFVKLIESL